MQWNKCFNCNLVKRVFAIFCVTQTGKSVSNLLAKFGEGLPNLRLSIFWTSPENTKEKHGKIWICVLSEEKYIISNVFLPIEGFLTWNKLWAAKTVVRLKKDTFAEALFKIITGIFCLLLKPNKMWIDGYISSYLIYSRLV